MKRKTYNNVIKAGKLIQKKGYSSQEALEMAVKLFDELEISHNGMSVEWLIDKLVVQENDCMKGKKFIWNPVNRATKQIELCHPHYGKIVTVISEDTLNRLWVSVDSFPECNHREHKNRFLVDINELVKL